MEYGYVIELGEVVDDGDTVWETAREGQGIIGARTAGDAALQLLEEYIADVRRDACDPLAEPVTLVRVKVITSGFTRAQATYAAT